MPCPVCHRRALMKTKFLILSQNLSSGSMSAGYCSNVVLSVTKRQNEDGKTICELFFCLMDEMEDITFGQSMRIILDALLDTVMEYFHITESQPEEFTSNFIDRLPKYMQNALGEANPAA